MPRRWWALPAIKSLLSTSCPTQILNTVICSITVYVIYSWLISRVRDESKGYEAVDAPPHLCKAISKPHSVIPIHINLLSHYIAAANQGLTASLFLVSRLTNTSKR